MGSPLTGAATSVAAHNLLNSASVVVLASSLLRDSWELLSDQDRLDMLNRLSRHADFLAAGLKELVQTGEGPPIGPPSDAYLASARHRP
jgi:hypothetical protein